MPAISLRTYVVTQQAPVFDLPAWWDLDRLLAAYSHRRMEVEPGDKSTLLLPGWEARFWDEQARSSNEAAVHPTPAQESLQHQQDQVASALQEARWVIVHQGRVWIVPQEASEACFIFEGPPWWDRPEPWKAFITLRKKRLIEEESLGYIDQVRLLTGEEARAVDERAQRGYLEDNYFPSADTRRYLRKEMARFADALRKAVWVVMYEYEWESGLA